jgi:pyrimidine operon attenuation protein / uracil phosphoribosyltransferase
LQSFIQDIIIVIFDFMESTTTCVLNKSQVLQKIRRIAYEIYENNPEEKEITLAGIEGQGFVFAEKLKKELEEISGIRIQIIKVKLNKMKPLESEVTIDTDLSLLTGKTVILADDVLNTGKTLVYALKPFLKTEIKKLQTAVIVNRSHKLFPVAADYAGYSLATTLKEHIEVVLGDEEKMGVYLF